MLAVMIIITGTFAPIRSVARESALTDSVYGKPLSFFSPWYREIRTCTLSGVFGPSTGAGLATGAAGLSWVRTLTDEASANANTSAIVCRCFVTDVLLLRRPVRAAQSRSVK